MSRSYGVVVLNVNTSVLLYATVLATRAR